MKIKPRDGTSNDDKSLALQIFVEYVVCAHVSLRIVLELFLGVFNRFLSFILIVHSTGRYKLVHGQRLYTNPWSQNQGAGICVITDRYVGRHDS